LGGAAAEFFVDFSSLTIAGEQIWRNGIWSKIGLRMPSVSVQLQMTQNSAFCFIFVRVVLRQNVRDSSIPHD